MKAAGFLLVRKQDIDVSVDQVVQEAEVFFDDVETRQIEGDLQSALFGDAYGVRDQFVILHQVAFDVEVFVTVENFGRKFGMALRAAAPR